MLDRVDRNSPTWLAVQRVAERRLASAQAAVLRGGVDERTSDFERGAAAFAKEILDLGAPPVEATAATPIVTGTAGY